MHASPALPHLERWLRGACPAIHAGRLTALVAVVGALVRGGKLALTHLGRNLAGAAYAKHDIKRVDRLLGNRHLTRERPAGHRAVEAEPGCAVRFVAGSSREPSRRPAGTENARISRA